MGRVSFCGILCGLVVGMLFLTPVFALNYGDFKSSTLAGKAWAALGADKYEDAVQYADKCIELYAENAGEMQAGLKALPQGSMEEIAANYWALNDVATVLYIKIKALVALDKVDEAKKALTMLVNDYSFGQCYDPSWKGFWQPAEAAKTDFPELL